MILHAEIMTPGGPRVFEAGLNLLNNNGEATDIRVEKIEASRVFGKYVFIYLSNNQVVRYYNLPFKILTEG